MVTGTPGGAQKRAIGNVVGVMVVPSTGMVGGSGSIRIRGVTSPAPASDPLIYVDGIRVDNTRGGPPGRGGPQMRRIDDLNINDIESLEIIKGPAAATLYGTEASNGVIQIFTKRGVQGRPIWEFTVRQGGNYQPCNSALASVRGHDPAASSAVGSCPSQDRSAASLARVRALTRGGHLAVRALQG
ncbi:MAG: TonB-dependent receptor plug domain-containing protein [Gemmatimonadetes bacterium]|nr:TonB-dependent receptor plug domain-containing protein [Gemmatimonadota bacterium]